MTNEPVTFVSLTAATVAIPTAASSDAPPGTHLVGAGLLIATRDGNRWRFSSEAATIAAGEKEQGLLLWLADRLPLPVQTEAGSLAWSCADTKKRGQLSAKIPFRRMSE